MTGLTQARPGVSLRKRRPCSAAAYTGLVDRLKTSAALAALAAGAAGIHAPHDTWTGMSDGTATTVLDDGTRLVHTPGMPFTAWSICPHRIWHSTPVDTPADLATHGVTTSDCPGHGTAREWPDVVHLSTRDAPMGGPMTKYESTCKDKRRFPSRSDAKRVAGHIRRTGGPSFQVYKCPFCATHHLGNRRGHATHMRKDMTSPTRTRPATETA